MPLTITGLENDTQNHRVTKRDISHPLTLSLLLVHDKGDRSRSGCATELNARHEWFNQLQAWLRLVERNAPLVEGTVDTGMTHLYICVEMGSCIHESQLTIPGLENDTQNHRVTKRDISHPLTLSLSHSLTLSPLTSYIMFDPTQFTHVHWLLSPLVIFGRYAVMCIVCYLIFYIWKRRIWLYRKIQHKFPQGADYQREIGYSALTSLIFGAISWLLLGTSLRQYTQFYTDIQQYGMVWLIASIPLTLLVHDAYFYWLHRWMHQPKWYRIIHLTHHKSVNPSPWAAYAFHPVEALLEAGILPVLLIFIPLHPISFFGFITLMLLFNVYGHLGYELFSKKTYEHPVGRWLNSSVHHNLHHEKFNGNFGLYFTIWDRLCGTLREDSLDKIEEVHSRERSEK